MVSAFYSINTKFPTRGKKFFYTCGYQNRYQISRNFCWKIFNELSYFFFRSR